MRFKLDRVGDFFNLEQDIHEKRPLKVESLTGDAEKAVKLLQSALDQFQSARPQELARSGQKAGQKKLPARTRSRSPRNLHHSIHFE